MVCIQSEQGDLRITRELHTNIGVIEGPSLPWPSHTPGLMAGGLLTVSGLHSHRDFF